MKYPIDQKEKVLLGGLKQTIHIWGTKAENPVVLFLHGGPGIPNRYNILERHADLLPDFTLVAWDQRGTGGSYFGCVPESLTLEQLIADGAELIDYLCQKLGKRKLFLLGIPCGFPMTRHFPKITMPSCLNACSARTMPPPVSLTAGAAPRSTSKIRRSSPWAAAGW